MHKYILCLFLEDNYKFKVKMKMDYSQGYLQFFKTKTQNGTESSLILHIVADTY